MPKYGLKYMAQEAKIDTRLASLIVVEEHVYKYIPPKHLTELSLDLDLGLVQRLEEIAQALHVSFNSVVVGLIESGLQEEKKKEKNRGKKSHRESRRSR